MEDIHCVIQHKLLDNYALSSIRSYLYRYVPMLAVDKVTFEANTTQHGDDMLAHRLGLLLLCGTPHSSEPIILNARANGTGKNYRCIVTSDALQLPEGVVLWNPFPEAPCKIATLAENDELKLQLSLRKGQGHEHARFQPIRIARVTCEKNPSLHVEGLGNGPVRNFVVEAIDLFIQDLTQFVQETEKMIEDLRTQNGAVGLGIHM